MKKRVLMILFKIDLNFLIILILNMFYDTLKNNIIKRCLVVNFNDQSLGGESFETIVNESSKTCDFDSK